MQGQQQARRGDDDITRRQRCMVVAVLVLQAPGQRGGREREREMVLVCKYHSK